MKFTSTKFTLLSTFAACAPLFTASGAQDYILQTDYTTGLTSSIYFNGPEPGNESSGTIGPNRIEALGTKGAKFELFAVDLANSQIFPEPLDTKLTGTYMPQATITLESQDPKEGILRTRADEAYYTRIDISSLLSGADAPNASKRVYVERLFSQYTSNDRLPINGDINYSVADAAEKGQTYIPSAFFINKNGSIEGEFTTAMNETSPTEWFKQKGEEVIRVYSLPDANLGWEVIAEKRIQLRPVATAKITATLNGSEIDTSPHLQSANSLVLKLTGVPTFRIDLSDLYPTSSTYAIIYKGTYQSNGATAAQTRNVVAKDYDSLNFNTVVPQNGLLTLSNQDWAQAQKENTVYTLEVRTKTAFNDGTPETLTWLQFEPRIHLNINANVTTSE